MLQATQVREIATRAHARAQELKKLKPKKLSARRRQALKDLKSALDNLVAKFEREFDEKIIRSAKRGSKCVRFNMNEWEKACDGLDYRFRNRVNFGTLENIFPRFLRLTKSLLEQNGYSVTIAKQEYGFTDSDDIERTSWRTLFNVTFHKG